jgi:RNA-directed DNA polymerase
MLKATHIRRLTHGSAAALLCGPWDPDAMQVRLADALGSEWSWCRPLIDTLCNQFDQPPSPDALIHAIVHAASFQKAISNRTRPNITHWYAFPATMQNPFPAWDLPHLATQEDLRKLLGLTHSELQWLADCEQRQARSDSPSRHHYHFQWLPKRSGGWRLLEVPRFLLKQTQRRLLDHLLSSVVPHPAACAFRAGRSIVDFAAPHAKKNVVLHFDLKEFFPSIAASRIHATFRTLGYSTPVARLMTGLCTSTTPHAICRQHEGGQIYSAPHLPQGAPTSPALANLAAYRMDCRLAAAAEAIGATYTRYADDLAFSGNAPLSHAVSRFQTMVWRIVYEEGFELQHRKTRVMHKSVRQRLCGLVVNDHLNIDRTSYDQLKATLTNCCRHGLDTQNRENHPDFHAHLKGRIAYVEQINPTRAKRLRALFEQIPPH